MNVFWKEKEQGEKPSRQSLIFFLFLFLLNFKTWLQLHHTFQGCANWHLMNNIHVAAMVVTAVLLTKQQDNQPRYGDSEFLANSVSESSQTIVSKVVLCLISRNDMNLCRSFRSLWCTIISNPSCKKPVWCTVQKEPDQSQGTPGFKSLFGHEAPWMIFNLSLSCSSTYFTVVL